MNLCCLKLTSVIPSASYDISQHKVKYRVCLAFLLGNHCLQILVFQSILVLQLWSAPLHCEGFSIRDWVLAWARRDIKLQRGDAASLTRLGLRKSVLALTFTSSSFSFLAHEAFPYELITQETTSSLYGTHLGSVQSSKTLTYHPCKTGW